MTLTAGSRLGPYKILSALGFGGMGEVYRATDTNLKREVAIKVLPTSVAADAERLARFQREAEVLAALNHPNIAHIFGLEKSDGTIALVMELVEGPTLADRIAQGAIPLDEALPIARQIAEALEAAHDQGIIHRDLKPANIKVRVDGTVKVLDFGLAKAIESAGSRRDASQSPTITTPAMTLAGIILGTAAYMSPEQARGRPVDKRTDIWAFGCVLYEMLTGTRPFGGDDVSDTLAEVLRSEPAWSALPAETPEPIRRLLRRCLVKDNRQRLPEVGSARLEFADALTLQKGDVTAQSAPKTRIRHGVAWALAVLSLVAAALSLGRALVLRPLRETSYTQTTILPPENLDFGGTGAAPGGHAVLSPDGRYIVIPAGRRLWLRALDALEARPIEGTEGAGLPFWSPDNKSVGFFTIGKLKRIGLDGGSAITVADAVAGRGGTWGTSGQIVFAPGPADPLMRVPVAGGTPEPATVLDPQNGITSHRFPAFLPDGEHFVFLATSVNSSATPVGGIQMASLGSTDARTVVAAGRNNETLSAPIFAGGYLLFLRQNALMAQRLNTGTWTVEGAQIAVASDVSAIPILGELAVSASQSGWLLYHAGTEQRPAQIVWLDRAGIPSTPSIGSSMNPNACRPAISPDSSRAVANPTMRSSASRQIWAYDLHTGLTAPLTTSANNHDNPTWSPDGQFIAYSVSRDGGREIVRRAADGSGDEKVLIAGTPQTRSITDWSPDGKLLLFAQRNGPEDRIRAVPAEGGEPWDVVEAPATLGAARFSPSGNWIVYESAESGHGEIYAAPFSGARGALAGRKIKLSANGGIEPRWRRDGKEILYIAPGGKMTAAEVQILDGTLHVGAERTLFTVLGIAGWDVTANGQRFLACVAERETGPRPLVLIQNWLRKIER